MVFMRPYELMVILDPSLDERNVGKSMDQFLEVVRNGGGSVEQVDVWGRRRLSYEINKQAEAIYVVLDVNSGPDTVAELDRQLNLNDSVLRTKLLRKVEPRKSKAKSKA